MKKVIFTLLLMLSPLPAHAEESVYEIIGKLSIIEKNYVLVKTPAGIDLKSKNVFKNSKGFIEPINHMELEGPLENTGVKTLEEGMNILIEVIKPEIDIMYEVNNPVIPGLSANKVDVNGTYVGLFDYKIKHEPNTYVKRAVILSDKGLYSFSMEMHQSEPNSKIGLHFMAVIIAAVNSGKL